MKLIELGINLNKNIDFDIVEDALVFMKNDPMFYRKEYYPSISKMADLHRAGSKYNAKKILMPMITHGINRYCKKYHLANMPDDLFHQDHRKSLFDKIYNDEIKQIKDGEYK